MKNTMKQYVDYIVNGGKSTMLGIGPRPVLSWVKKKTCR